MKKVSGFFIDALQRKVSKIEVETLEDMQRCVGGFIELAPGHNTSQTLYVNEEGLIKGFDYGFSFGGSEPFLGNGLLLGPVDNHGHTLSCTMPIEVIKVFTIFYTAASLKAYRFIPF